MTTKWDWALYLSPEEAARVAELDALIHRLAARTRAARQAKVSDAVARAIRNARAERLAIANRGTARARIAAGLANPARKARAAARLARTEGAAT